MKTIGTYPNEVLVGGAGALPLPAVTPTEPGRIHVVSAAIVRAGRILFAQRDQGTSFAWSWCTPGGKVEPGERPLAALTRELLEEIGLTFGLLELEHAEVLYETHLDFPRVTTPLRVTCYCIDLATPAEALAAMRAIPGDKIVGVGWFGASDILAVPLAPADHAFRTLLADTAAGRRPQRSILAEAGAAGRAR